MSKIITYPTKNINKKGKPVNYVLDEICCYTDINAPTYNGSWKNTPLYIGGIDPYEESQDSKGSLETNKL